MKVCFDTCIVIDILGKTDRFYDAYCAYDVALVRGFTPCLSVSSTTDICYLLHSRGLMSSAKAHAITERVLDLFELIENTAQDCHAAAQSAMDDYEDALIATSSYHVGVDLIITRNVSDFVAGPLTAIEPVEFVHLYKPDGINYDFIDFDHE